MWERAADGYCQNQNECARCHIQCNSSRSYNSHLASPLHSRRSCIRLMRVYCRSWEARFEEMRFEAEHAAEKADAAEERAARWARCVGLADADSPIGGVVSLSLRPPLGALPIPGGGLPLPEQWTADLVSERSDGAALQPPQRRRSPSVRVESRGSAPGDTAAPATPLWQQEPHLQQPPQAAAGASATEPSDEENASAYNHSRQHDRRASNSQPHPVGRRPISQRLPQLWRTSAARYGHLLPNSPAAQPAGPDAADARAGTAHGDSSAAAARTLLEARPAVRQPRSEVGAGMPRLATPATKGSRSSDEQRSDVWTQAAEAQENCAWQEADAGSMLAARRQVLTIPYSSSGCCEPLLRFVQVKWRFHAFAGRDQGLIQCASMCARCCSTRRSQRGRTAAGPNTAALSGGTQMSARQNRPAVAAQRRRNVAAAVRKSSKAAEKRPRPQRWRPLAAAAVGDWDSALPSSR